MAAPLALLSHAYLNALHGIFLLSLRSPRCSMQCSLLLSDSRHHNFAVVWTRTHTVCSLSRWRLGTIYICVSLTIHFVGLPVSRSECLPCTPIVTKSCLLFSSGSVAVIAAPLQELEPPPVVSVDNRGVPHSILTGHIFFSHWCPAFGAWSDNVRSVVFVGIFASGAGFSENIASATSRRSLSKCCRPSSWLHLVRVGNGAGFFCCLCGADAGGYVVIDRELGVGDRFIAHPSDNAHLLRRFEGRRGACPRTNG